MDRCLYMLYVKLSQGHMHTQTLIYVLMKMSY